MIGEFPQGDIIVKGGGSGDGISALLHGIVDISMTSRNLTREIEYAAAGELRYWYSRWLWTASQLFC